MKTLQQQFDGTCDLVFSFFHKDSFLFIHMFVCDMCCTSVNTRYTLCGYLWRPGEVLGPLELALQGCEPPDVGARI